MTMTRLTKWLTSLLMAVGVSTTACAQETPISTAREFIKQAGWDATGELIVSKDTNGYTISCPSSQYRIYLNENLQLRQVIRFVSGVPVVPLHKRFKDDASVIAAASRELRQFGIPVMGTPTVKWPDRNSTSSTGFDNEVYVTFSDTPGDLDNSVSAGNRTELCLELSSGELSYLYLDHDWTYASSKGLTTSSSALEKAKSFLKEAGYSEADLSPYRSTGPSYLSPAFASTATASGEKYRGRREIRSGFTFIFGGHTVVQVDGATGEILSAGVLKSGSKGPSQAAQAKLAAKVAERPNPLLFWVGGSAVILSTFAIWRKSAKRP